MPHPLSPLGIAHTLISLAPVVAGLYGFVRFGRIETGSRAGRVYLAGLALSVFTSFGLSSVVGVNPGHVLGVLALLAAFGGTLLVPRGCASFRLGPYLKTFGLSFSFFLLLVPGINETLSRLPTAHPVATGPEDPVVKTALFVWLLLFIAGFVLQSVRLSKTRPEGGDRIGASTP